MRTSIIAAILLATVPGVMAEDMAHDMAREHGGAVDHMFVLEAETGGGPEGAVSGWDLDGWIGTDDNKLWLKSEGEGSARKLEDAETWALYSRNIATFWDLQAGTRRDTAMISIMSELGSLWASAREVNLKRGANLFRMGDPVRSMYRVIAGAVGLERSLPNGTSLILQIARPGSMLAEPSLFAPTYHCDATVQQDCVVARLPKAKVVDALKSPLFALPLVQKLAHDLQATRMRAETLALRTVKERLDAWLLFNGPGLSPPKARTHVMGHACGAPKHIFL